MRFAWTDEQQALRDELRSYFSTLVTPEIAAEAAEGEMGGEKSIAAVRQMARDGWLTVGWPKEYGGRGFTPLEQFIFYDEAQRAGAPLPFLTINSVAPAIMQFGTDEQKADLLPRISRGECFFSIGYTEPQSGTDLASLQTRAVRDGDDWVINGQKIFTSLTDHAHYIWLAVRTNPDAPKHQSISIVLVPTDAPGFSYTPIHTVAGATTYATYYQDVRVPVSNTIGPVDGGWGVIVTQLNYERVALAPPGWLERALTDVRRWAQDTKLADGRRVIDQEWVQVHLAKVRAKLEALRLLNWQFIYGNSVGVIDVAQSSATKVFGTTSYIECYQLLMEVLGAAGTLRRGSEGAILSGALERTYRGVLILTFGGGTNEVQRDLIAMFGLKQPRSMRA
ncbi:MAG TPA: acyl-CoA dehydrogenase family protein [Mycobacteriales bacterium]|nr:acyl-CoA dehydrogenase family protein [Mycobacteriales bacterium]